MAHVYGISNQVLFKTKFQKLKFKKQEFKTQGKVFFEKMSMFFSGRISNLIRENELLFIVTSPDLESHKCKRVPDFLNNNFILERRRICCISNINGIMALVKKSCSYLLCVLSEDIHVRIVV